jgi:alkanesulfonate monooxygenase SsuD/methylene tetrahydromethanopterin reductase-like flavin-dependent oxidoreductase (luciferase family)
MKLHYMPDTHGGPYDRPYPTPKEVAEFTDQLFRESEMAEEAGFDSLQIPERHMRTECMFPSPLILMSALAARTSRIRLGTYILILPLYNPMHIAEQFAMIDNLSRGRVIMGVASGYHTGYNQMFNVPFHERGARFEEGFDVVTKAWTGEKFSFDGKYYQYKDVQLIPGVYQKPRPEIWIGGMFPKTIARAGRLGDAWCSDPFPLDPKVWNEQVKLYRDSAKQHGHKSKVVLMREAWCAPTREQAEETFLKIAVEEWLFYYRWGILTHHPEFQKESDFTVERALKHFVCGTPEDCISQIKMYEREYDVDEIVLRFRLPGGPPRPKVLESLKMFGKEVMPEFTRKSRKKKK